jgi:hypothetical protein
MDYSTTTRPSHCCYLCNLPMKGFHCIYEDNLAYYLLHPHGLTQQLEMLNMSLQKQQQAIMMLVNLQSAGISESEILELIGLVNQWGGVGQRNGSNSNMNDSSGGKEKFQLNDRLKLT